MLASFGLAQMNCVAANGTMRFSVRSLGYAFFYFKKKKERALMKKTISLLLALVMCLSLCACGGTDEPETTVNTEKKCYPGTSIETLDACFPVKQESNESNPYYFISQHRYTYSVTDNSDVDSIIEDYKSYLEEQGYHEKKLWAIYKVDTYYHGIKEYKHFDSYIATEYGMLLITKFVYTMNGVSEERIAFNFFDNNDFDVSDPGSGYPLFDEQYPDFFGYK